MEGARRFIFKNTVTEEVFVLPVTPSGYQISHGRKTVQVDMHGAGTVNLPGETTLLNESIECFFPARAYPFAQPEAGTNPFVPLEILERWCDAGDPVRFIVSDTPVNALVLLDPISYGERDGTRDLYVTIPMRGYRILTAPTTEIDNTANAVRPVETEPTHATTYVVRRGDTLSSIAKWVYGDASLYGKLAAANGISNPNLIQVGQVLTLPDVKALPAAEKPSKMARVAEKVETTLVDTESINEVKDAPRSGNTGVWKVQLAKEEAMEIIASKKEAIPTGTVVKLTDYLGGKRNGR